MNLRVLVVKVVAILFAGAVATAGELHEAARGGDLGQVKASLADNQLDGQDSAGETPLTLAAIGGHFEVVQALVDAGASLDGRNHGGLTPLHAAAYGGHLDVAEWLVDQGAEVNDIDNFYRTSPLHLAAEENHKDVVAMLLARGAEIEAEERNGYTPLTQAGWREYWDVADLLMQAGATCQPAELVGDWLHEECSKRR